MHMALQLTVLSAADKKYNHKGKQSKLETTVH